MKTGALICIIGHRLSIRKIVTDLFHTKKYQIESHESVESFLSRKAHEGPCCLVLDAEVSALYGLSIQQTLSKNQRTEQIIFTSLQGDVYLCAQAFKAGAVDFLTKPLQEHELIQAVEEALARSEQLFRSRQERQAAQTLVDTLTPREREVLTFVISGQLNKVIAAELATTEKTIKKHRGQITKKLRVSSVAELVHLSMTSGLKPAHPYGTKVPYTNGN